MLSSRCSPDCIDMEKSTIKKLASNGMAEGYKSIGH